MLKAVLEKPFKIKLLGLDVLAPKRKEVLIKVLFAGVCGTDLHAYRGTQPFISYPRVLGHEIAGEIAEIGEDVKGRRKGDLVTVDPVFSCGKCYACRVGRRNCCRDVKVMGVHIDGGFSEYITVPSNIVYEAPHGISPEILALTEPLSIGVQASNRANICGEDKVAILGAGTIGLASLLIAKTKDCKVIVADLIPRRLKLAKELGADRIVNVKEEDLMGVITEFTEEDGASVVIEATGSPQAVEDSIRIVSPAGRIVILGLTNKSVKIFPMELIRKELDFRGSRLNNKLFPYTLGLLPSMEDKVRKLVTHRFHIKDINVAFELLDKHSEKVIKVFLAFTRSH
jgi:L-gulonate 5-dehydrogenase